MRRAIEAALTIVLLAVFLATFVLRTYYIPSISMIPTFHIGDFVLANMLTYHLHAPADDDIALFTPSGAAVDGDHEPFIKRVIGMPGDTIRVTDGIVYRNGQPLEEPYENQTPNYNLAIRDRGIFLDDGTGVMMRLPRASANIPPAALWQAPDRIPKGFYFVLGDNRRYSRDSHVWGFIPEQQFIGKALAISWPLNRLRFFSR